ncbi:aldolase/citrate lyase family protein [Streptomyces sp. NPDC046716]|uniref:aldolase/citrate lyase family protein n=1 Tax=Streptomyces sp. NPDC046716 TaxID=3157093 RepID=UPI0033C2B542
MRPDPAPSIAAARGLRFVPGDRPDRLAKAAASGADPVVIDLGDAVAPADEAAARAHATTWLADGHAAVVRINAAGTAWSESDLATAVEHGGP